MIGDRIFPGLLTKETLEQAIGAAIEGERDEGESVALRP
jgi:hypothetical protein